jgi:hypothetical protein
MHNGMMRQWLRMRTPVAAVTVVCLIVGGGSAKAGDTGNELFKHCTTPNRGRAVCEAYIDGAVDAFSASDDTGICMPGSATYGQADGIVRKYLMAHPESRHFAASLLIMWALQEAWPCPPR